MADLNLKISPEELREYASNIIKHTNRIKELVADSNEAINSLSGWQSSNKDFFVEKVRSDNEKAMKMTEAAESYGLVASDVAAAVLGVENAVRNAITKAGGVING